VRLLLLYARSRGAPAAVLAVIALCLAGAGAGQWLAGRPTLDDATARLPVTVALAVAVAVVLAGTLYSPADEIERAAPRPWQRWRAGHATTLALLGTVFVSPVLPTAVHGQAALLRNTAGLLGLALLAAVVVGPRLAWALPLGYAAAVYLFEGLRDSPDGGVFAFLLQPGASRSALAAGLLLLALGIGSWAKAGRNSTP